MNPSSPEPRRPQVDLALLLGDGRSAEARAVLDEWRSVPSGEATVGEALDALEWALARSFTIPRRNPQDILACAERILARSPEVHPQTVRRMGGSGVRTAVTRRLSRPVLLGLASATVVIVLLAIGDVVKTSLVPSRAAVHSLVTYVTGNGERADIKLRDGTTIMLNVASRLELPEDFGKNNRTVRLWGEAYFNVAHAAGAPFIIDAGETRTTVLGTELAVRAYRPTDVRVAVRSGRVSVSSTGHATPWHAVLNANDVGHTHDGALVVSRHQSVGPLLGFVTGRLVLADVQLRDAIEELDRWYDVDIRLGDTVLGSLHLSSTLANGSVGDLVDILRLTLDVRVVRNGRVLTLYAR